MLNKDDEQVLFLKPEQRKEKPKRKYAISLSPDEFDKWISEEDPISQASDSIQKPESGDKFKKFKGKYGNPYKKQCIIKSYSIEISEKVYYTFQDYYATKLKKLTLQTGAIIQFDQNIHIEELVMHQNSSLFLGDNVVFIMGDNEKCEKQDVSIHY